MADALQQTVSLINVLQQTIGITDALQQSVNLADALQKTASLADALQQTAVWKMPSNILLDWHIREILILIQPFKHTVPSGFLIHL